MYLPPGRRKSPTLFGWACALPTNFGAKWSRFLMFNWSALRTTPVTIPKAPTKMSAICNPFAVGQRVRYAGQFYTVCEATPDHIGLINADTYKHIGIETKCFQRIQIVKLKKNPQA
jgi:hypothetical protein